MKPMWFLSLFLWAAVCRAAAEGQREPAGVVGDTTAGGSSSVPADTTGIPPAAEATPDTSQKQPVQAVLSLGYSKGTYVLSMGPSFDFGAYAPEFHFLPVTFLESDPYNEGKWNISWSALVPLGLGAIVSVFHSPEFPAVVQEILGAVLLGPVVLLNSQHHLVLVGPTGLIESGQLRLTAFVGCRTDCYSRAVTWVRWTPIAGVQQGFNLSGGDDTSAANWLSIYGGIESPVDFSSGRHSMPSTLFLGLRYGWKIQ
jgi:hypothetical protein